jgi:hypothetical protein
MASKETWEIWHGPALNKGENEDILSMISDVVETIHSLERMYGNVAARLTVRGLLQEYHALAGVADARDLRNYARP